MTVKREDLLSAPEGAFLLCDMCGGQYSANAADYWMVEDEHIFECCDGLSLVLATTRTTLTIVKE